MSGDAQTLSSEETVRRDWLARVLDFHFPDAGAATPPAPPPGFDWNAPNPNRVVTPKPELTGLGLWQAERGKAVTALTQLEAAFKATDHAERDEGIILLRAVRANLTGLPQTQRQMDEMQRYLETDDVVQAAELPNAFGVEVALREPLLRALAGLRAAAGGQGGGA